MSRWVGVTGRAGAGKDFLFKSLFEINPDFHRVSFAGALRSEIEAVLGVAIPSLYEKPTTPDIRKLLQWWGSDLRRREDPDYWIEKGEQAGKAFGGIGIPVFTDVRFPNEADMIRRNGGIIVRVMAPPEVRAERLGELPPEHISETAMDEYEVDAHVTSIAENSAYFGQVRRVEQMALEWAT